MNLPFIPPFDWDNTDAFREGWGLRPEADGRITIRKVDMEEHDELVPYPCPCFADDVTAAMYVMQRAKEGSEYHGRAYVAALLSNYRQRRVAA